MRRLAITIALLGCSSEPEPAASSAPSAFLAFERDFQGFRSWEKFSFPGTSEALPAHLAGPRDAYLNVRPPKGSKEFPVGTIIVKEVLDDGPITERVIFARVKRGHGFNVEAHGWEWFQLKQRADGSIGIVWRGLGPPADQDAALPYPQTDGCTPCHKTATDNDLVLAEPLRLSSL